ncbi:hypothetical protein BC829DRAFT_402014 [Chytridium lagenaria]|nr:hypothetical protein BC829DRAFT_402014 [Chytridium lagenaria]
MNGNRRISDCISLCAKSQDGLSSYELDVLLDSLKYLSKSNVRGERWAASILVRFVSQEIGRLPSKDASLCQNLVQALPSTVSFAEIDDTCMALRKCLMSLEVSMKSQLAGIVSIIFEELLRKAQTDSIKNTFFYRIRIPLMQCSTESNAMRSLCADVLCGDNVRLMPLAAQSLLCSFDRLERADCIVNFANWLWHARTVEYIFFNYRISEVGMPAYWTLLRAVHYCLTASFFCVKSNSLLSWTVCHRYLMCAHRTLNNIKEHSLRLNDTLLSSKCSSIVVLICEALKELFFRHSSISTIDISEEIARNLFECSLRWSNIKSHFYSLMQALLASKCNLFFIEDVIPVALRDISLACELLHEHDFSQSLQSRVGIGCLKVLRIAMLLSNTLFSELFQFLIDFGLSPMFTTTHVKLSIHKIYGEALRTIPTFSPVHIDCIMEPIPFAQTPSGYDVEDTKFPYQKGSVQSTAQSVEISDAAAVLPDVNVDDYDSAEAD